MPRHAVLRAGLALAVKAVSDGLGRIRLGSINDVLHPCGGYSTSVCRHESAAKRWYRPAVAHGAGAGKDAEFSTQCGSKVSERHQQAEGWVGEYQLALVPVGQERINRQVAGHPDRTEPGIPCRLRYRCLAAVRQYVCWAQDGGVQRDVGRQPVCYLPSGVIGRVPLIIGGPLGPALYRSHFCCSKKSSNASIAASAPNATQTNAPALCAASRYSC